MNEHRTFGYSWYFAVYMAIAFAFGSLVLVFPVITGEHSLVLWGILALWVVAFGEWVFRNPFRIEVGPDTVTAFWLGGRVKSWRREDLTIRDADRYRSQLAFLGRLEVVDHRGSPAFRLFPQLERFSELFDLLAPGIRGAVEQQAAKSWWSRDLLR